MFVVLFYEITNNVLENYFSPKINVTLVCNIVKFLISVEAFFLIS